MKTVTGLNALIDHFDTFILDQWGVLHNGGQAFPKAVEALKFLKENNKKVVILSNSGNSHSFSYQRLQDSGIDRNLYINVVTSGDHMRQNFRSGKFNHLGKNALFFSWDYNHAVLDDCNVIESDVDNASFVLCAGVDRGDLSNYMDDLKIARKRNLELVVSNPDLVAMSPSGALTMCPGTIAQAYQELGGIVHWHGKPQTEIYTMCKELVGGWDNAIAVGDSMAHDIAGANASNISSLFIRSGIHAKQISDQQSVIELAKKYSVQPSYCIDWFNK